MHQIITLQTYKMTLGDKILGTTPLEFEQDIKPKMRYLVAHTNCLMSAAKEADTEGEWFEFGVYSGKTLEFLTTLKDKVYGFDSFEGLPEEWNEHTISQDRAHPTELMAIYDPIKQKYIIEFIDK